MALPAFILPVVVWVCQPVMDAMQSCLQTGAQGFFSFCTNWVVGRVNSHLSSSGGAVVEVPVSWTSMVGAEETLDEIRNHLNDESVGIIGIYRMGGAGKTTLLQKINNDFFESGTRGKFDLVIWVTVSKEVNVSKIQKQIGGHPGLSVSLGDDESCVEKNAKILFEALSKKRFLVLLDDLWEKLDLVKVGIPVPRRRHRNCKIAFTTRSLLVCNDMDADKKVRVKLLDEARSWELFCGKLGADHVVVLNNDPSIGRLAKQVVHKCGGLPLALITVGKAMANKKLVGEWEHAVKALDASAQEIRGMEAQVLSCLKLSYDYLENDKMRSALLFCAMYPEDEDIESEQLIEYWVGEGLLDGDHVGGDINDDMDHARNRGHVLISNLQAACLLEPGIEDTEETVRMHDTVRDMARWLNTTSPGGDRSVVDAFLVVHDDGNKLTQDRLEHVRRVWMVELKSVSCIPSCPNSWTIAFKNSTLLKPLLVQSVCEFQRTLRVLDLSWTNLKNLPCEIGLLKELQYLSLHETYISSLPPELGGLVRLRHLNLRATCNLGRIPREAIVGLSSLQVLNMRDCDYHWGAQDGKSRPATEAATVLEEEENQQHSSSDDDTNHGNGEVEEEDNQQHSSSDDDADDGNGEVEEEDNQQHSSSDDDADDGNGEVEEEDNQQHSSLDDDTNHGSQQLELSDLEGLHKLQEMRIRLCSSHQVERLIGSALLCKCTRYLCLEKIKPQYEPSFNDDGPLYGKDGALLHKALTSTMGRHLRVLHLGGDMDADPWVGELRISLDDQLPCLEELVLLGEGGSWTTGVVLVGTTPESGTSSSVQRLQQLELSCCDWLTELKLLGKFPSLRTIDMFHCSRMEEVVLEDNGWGRRQGEESLNSSHFPMLKRLCLVGLHEKLESISGGPLFLPSLEAINVESCPWLRRLPLSPGSAPKLKIVRGEQKWWDGLEWCSGNNDYVDVFVPFG